MANNFPELRNEIALFVKMAEGADNEIMHLETWQVKSLLTGKFMRPNSVLDTTAQDIAFDDTGDLSNKQIVARLMLDGEMPTKNCKPVT